MNLASLTFRSRSQTFKFHGLATATKWDALVASLTDGRRWIQHGFGTNNETGNVLGRQNGRPERSGLFFCILFQLKYWYSCSGKIRTRIPRSVSLYPDPLDDRAMFGWCIRLELINIRSTILPLVHFALHHHLKFTFAYATMNEVGEGWIEHPRHLSTAFTERPASTYGLLSEIFKSSFAEATADTVEVVGVEPTCN